MVKVRIFAAVLASLLSACGGGGGGGDAVPAAVAAANTLEIIFDSSKIAMAYDMGTVAPAEAVINATAKGDISTTNLFVSATGAAGVSDPNIGTITGIVTGMTARIAVKPKAGLPAGTYKGTLVFNACADAACKTHHRGSPWSVSYTLSVNMMYAAIDTSALGMPRTLMYDAAHGDIYASYPTTYEATGLSAVVRFRLSAGGWTNTNLSVPGLIDVALAPDGSVMGATDISNQVRLIDLGSFSITSTHLSATGIADTGSNTEVGIAFTNDGKLWMPTGSGYQWHGLGYFDIRSSTFGNATPACGYCYMGPYFAVSRDGSRLMVTQSAGMSPAPDMLYLDVSDGTFKNNPIGLTFFYWLTSLSDNGDRFLMNGDTVYDRAFGTVGTIPQPASGVRAAQMSPDGRRAYVLDYAVEPGTADLPVVHVYDTSAPAGSAVVLPLVGNLTLADFPSCQTASYPATSCYKPRMQVTPDGKNLLVLGDRKLIVAPIPKTLSGITD